MKKNKKQNIILIAIAVIIIGGIITYNYYIEQNRQKGFRFGNELLKIQEEVKQIQIDFNSRVVQWQENDLTKEELLEYSDKHFKELNGVLVKYDELVPPRGFSASVELFRLSTQSQIESDKEFVEWIRSNQKSNKIRSDSLLQESFDYEMMALREFNTAKLGTKEYDTSGKFEAPNTDFTDKVNKIFENMKDECYEKQGQKEESETNQQELEKCLSKAQIWRTEHLP